MSNVQIAREYIQKAFPGFPVPVNTYLVLSTARSGSTMLTAYLGKIGHGFPIEAFNPNKNSRTRYNWGIDYSDPRAYIQKAIEFQTVNDVMGMKFMPNQYFIFLDNARRLLQPANLDLDDAEIVEVLFPATKYIHLERKNKLKQAISFSKALQDGIWREVEGEDQAYKDYVTPAQYDREHIERCLDLSMANDNYWRYYLRKNRISHLHVFYEDLSGNYQQEMTRIHEYLGITNQVTELPPLRKQATGLSEEWAERFTAETEWFTSPRFKALYERGNQEDLFVERSRLVFNQREQERWKKMPSNRTRKLRALKIRIWRKFSAMMKR